MKYALKLSVFAMFFSLCSILAAADKGGPITGKVSMTKDEKGKVSAMTLTADDGAVYNIAVSGKGSTLAKEDDGVMIEAEGAVKKKKAKGEEAESLWLTLKSYNLRFAGTLTVEKKGKNIAKISLGEYQIKLDGKSKKMAAEAEGKNVIITGTKKTKKVKDEEVTTVTVKSYVLDDEKKDKKDKKDKKEKK